MYHGEILQKKTLAEYKAFAHVFVRNQIRIQFYIREFEVNWLEELILKKLIFNSKHK